MQSKEIRSACYKCLALKIGSTVVVNGKTVMKSKTLQLQERVPV